jgi:MFS family permease
MTYQNPTKIASSTPRLHYAWVIVAVASMICMITSPVRFAISMLVPYLQSPQGFGWSYFAISIAFALQWLVTALISPLVGWLGDRYGVRRTMLLGAYLFIVGMVLTGSMTRLWHFYLYFGILLAIPLTIFQVPLVAGVSVWFRTHMGVAWASCRPCRVWERWSPLPWSLCCSPISVWRGRFGAPAWWAGPWCSC